MQPPSRQTVYARLEVVVSNSANYGDDRVWFFYRDVSLIIKLYSDAACTQPYTPSAPLDYTIDKYGWYETLTTAGYYPHVDITGTIPAGESEYMAEEYIVFDEESTEYDGGGNLIYLQRYAYDYELLSVGDDYVIVPPVVYPSHPF